MVCVHTYSESDNALLRYGRLKFSKMAAGRHLEFDPTGNGAVGSAVPENPTLEPNTIVKFAICHFGAIGI